VNIKSLLVPAGLIAMLALPAIANADTVNGRLHDQHVRIEHGIRSGELTYGEQHRVEGRDARIFRTEHRDRFADHGRLTRGERFRLTGALNHNSRLIHRDKHNGSVREY
jgi:hypothetical protein